MSERRRQRRQNNRFDPYATNNDRERDDAATSRQERRNRRDRRSQPNVPVERQIQPPRPEEASQHISDENPPETCPICLVEYEDQDSLTILPCQHTFHFACIHRWEQESTRCPLCRAEMHSNEAVLIEELTLELPAGVNASIEIDVSWGADITIEINVAEWEVEVIIE